MDNRTREILFFDSLEIGYTSGKTRKVLLPPLKASAREGELIAVIGRNGIGKSTLLRSIAGLQPLLSGNLIIEDMEIHDYSRIKLSEKVGYISTEIVKVSNMRVYDLVSLGRFPHTDWFGSIDTGNHKAILDAIEKTGMKELADRHITELSDGERQRAMIAMVLAQDARIMIMDEPTAFLDISNKFEIIHLMHELTHLRNKTIIYSTHDFNTAVSQSDKIWLMLGDRIIEGAPEDIMINGSFNSLFDESKVHFNTSDGSFLVRNEYKGDVTITGGKGLKRYWTEKALKRSGFDVNDQSSLLNVIVPSTDDQGWKCIFRDSEGEFKSLYDLISWIRSGMVSS